LVGHTWFDVDAGRTLESLYLEPLRAWVRDHGGRALPDRRLTLLIDVKTGAEATWHAIRQRIAAYPDLFAGPDAPVVPVISGQRAQRSIRASRVAGIDGREGDLDSDEPSAVMPLISERFSAHFSWNGEGPMPLEERHKLRTWIRRAHGKGRQIRFWATADRPEIWDLLHQEGVDLINTDDLGGLHRFLRGR
jgi:hypothetical protein